MPRIKNTVLLLDSTRLLGWLKSCVNVYNELGELIDKKLHSTDDGASFEQSIDYRYNIRGWLTRINDAALSDGESDLFGMELAYNQDFGGGNTPAYNGNISAIKWSADFAGKERLYNYDYDPMNRLTSANYKAGKTGVWNLEVGKFDMSANYDKQGNITQLTRQNGLPDPLDDLRYTYKNNQLQHINDLGNHNKGFLESNPYQDDFTYDDNGNLTVDKNKGIAGTTYNYLNLVERIDGEDGGYVKYLYDADANKLGEEVYDTDGELEKRTDYIGKFVYVDDKLRTVKHREGSIKVSDDGTYEYEYDLRDHLGNTRVTFTTKEDIDTLKITFEEDFLLKEVPNIDNYTRADNDLFDHTDAGLDYTYSQLLTAGANSIIGVTKKLEVMSGDTVRTDVYGKYFNPTTTNSDVAAGIFGAALNAFGVPVAVPGEASAIGAFNDLFSAGSFIGTGDNAWEDDNAPKAYLNAIVFDKDYNVLQVAFDQIDVGAEQPLGDLTKQPHGLMSLEMVIEQPGYVYIYVSNENPTLVEVYFDDLEIRHHRSPIIQQDDYYPFGMSIAETAFQKDNPFYEGASFANRYGYQDLGFRRYDPSSGRFFNVDPLAELQLSESVYQYAGNNPVRYNDVLGLKKGDKKKKKRKHRRMVNGKKVSILSSFFKSKGAGKSGLGKLISKIGDLFKSKGKKETDKPTGEPTDTGTGSGSENNNGEKERFTPTDKWHAELGQDDQLNQSNRNNSSGADQYKRKYDDARGMIQSMKDGTYDEYKKNRNQELRAVKLHRELKGRGFTDEQVKIEALKKGGGELAIYYSKLLGRGDLSDKVSPDQNLDKDPKLVQPHGIVNMLESIKESVQMGHGSQDILLELMIIDDDYSMPFYTFNYATGRLILDGKEIDVEISPKGNLIEEGERYLIDLNNVEREEIGYAFGNSGTIFIKYTFKSAEGVYNDLEVTVKKEDAYDFEEYMGLGHSIDELLKDDEIPLTVDQIKEVRKLIAEVSDPVEKKKLYARLQYEVKNVNQRELESDAREGMCQLSVLAQCIIVKGIENPNPSMEFADYLESKNNDSGAENHRTTLLAWDALVEDLDLDTKYIDGGVLTEEEIKSKFESYLENGDGIMLSIRYKNPIVTTEIVNGVSTTTTNAGGHIVRLVGITETGIIVDDPYGSENPLGRYNYSETGEGYWTEINKETEDSTGKSDAGHHNTWFWDDVTNLKITYGIIIINK